MAMLLAYSTFGITSGKNCRDLKMVAILKMLEYKTQLQFDLRHEKIIQCYAKKVFFIVMTSSMTSHGRLEVDPIYIPL